MNLTSDDLLNSPDERSQELGTIATIYPELVLSSPFSATISIPVSPICPVPVSFHSKDTFFPVSHLPPLTLQINLPEEYPDILPPEIHISTTPLWLSDATITRLKAEIIQLWADLGHSQIVFTAIGHLQQSSDKAFDFASISLSPKLQKQILNFNTSTKKSIFENGTYECGICLEPKKGTQCHRLRSCTHVFCLPCLRSYFATMITEGQVSAVVCSDPVCVKKATKLSSTAALPTPPDTPKKRRGHKVMLPPTLPPDELKEIGLDATLVKRYVELKQKAALEKDPETVYCPRQWCQAPSRESITALESVMAENHTSYYLSDYGSEAIIAAVAAATSTPNTPPPEEDEGPEEPIDKLQICSRCSFAFCRICTSGWHGDLIICRSKDAALTADEIASETYLKENTTPCPTCNSPVLKSHGCNHMICKCQTHFCFLCSAYLPPRQPYKHFNTAGSSCYMRLWEGETGDGEHARLVGEGRVNIQGEELPEDPAVAADLAVAAEAERLRREAERNRRPFVVGVVAAAAAPPPPPPPPPRAVRARVAPARRVRGRFADWGGTDEEEDTEGEENGMDFDDVPDEIGVPGV